MRVRAYHGAVHRSVSISDTAVSRRSYVSTFAQLSLVPALQSTLDQLGYHTPTPIQAQTIPAVLEGQDLLGIAQTGTGKTASFALPILDRIARFRQRVKKGCVRALVLTPTRELASQVSASFKRYGSHIPLSQAVIFGGVGQNNQVLALQRGVDVLVATPGRLLDLMNQNYVNLTQLEIFVLDEADRMLDMGFIQDVGKIVARLPRQRQTLLFSATMPPEIAGLADSLLQHPLRVEVTPQSTPIERIEQKVLFVASAQKSQLLKLLLDQEPIDRVLVFTRTKHGADRVAKHLVSADRNVDVLHGNKSQSAREQALRRFRAGDTKVLIATDIAARGIDVVEISHVINFDLPNEPETYVHRIGRTARAGRDGVAISFCDVSERGYLKAIEKIIQYQVPHDTSHPFHDQTAMPPAAVAAHAPGPLAGHRRRNIQMKSRTFTPGMRSR
ncbi:MAG: DEAD/DEAH box helicase [Magnetococcales bacterium]|nr:DEAD/DEAH box helicase [Magnetococcales bacterium]